MVLEDDADIAAYVRDLAIADVIEIDAVEKYLSAGRALYHGDQLKQGALAGTGMAGKKSHLAFFQA
jgi:hypothetical protein